MNYSGAYNTFTPTSLTATQELTKSHSECKKEYKSLGCFMISLTLTLTHSLSLSLNLFCNLHNTQNGTRHTIAIYMKRIYLWNQKLVESFLLCLLYFVDNEMKKEKAKSRSKKSSNRANCMPTADFLLFIIYLFIFFLILVKSKNNRKIFFFFFYILREWSVRLISVFL